MQFICPFLDEHPDLFILLLLLLFFTYLFYCLLLYTFAKLTGWYFTEVRAICETSGRTNFMSFIIIDIITSCDNI